MADGLDVPSFGNFAIDDSSFGNQELLDSFLSPESATSDPTKLEKITDEKKKVVPPAQKKKVTKVVPKEEEEEEEEQEKKPEVVEDPFSVIKDEEEEEEEEQQKPQPPVKKKVTPAKEPVSPTNEEEEEEEGEQETNTFKVLAKELFKLNVFTPEEDEDAENIDISTPEQFLDRFNYEKKKGAIETVQNFIGQFGEDYQRAFEAIYVNGVSPKEYFSTFNKIENIQGMDLSLEANQEAVVRQGLLDQGMEEADVVAKLQKIKDYGDLEEESQRYHKVLVKKEASKIEQLNKEAQAKLQQEAAYKQQYSNNVTNILQEKLKSKEYDGIPLNPSLANELHDFLLVDKYKTQSGEKLTEFDRFILDLKRPENHAMKVKVALLLKTLEKDPTLSTVQKMGVTKKTDSLFNELARQKVKSSGSAKPSKSSGSSAFSFL